MNLVLIPAIFIWQLAAQGLAEERPNCTDYYQTRGEPHYTATAQAAAAKRGRVCEELDAMPSPIGHRFEDGSIIGNLKLVPGTSSEAHTKTMSELNQALMLSAPRKESILGIFRRLIDLFKERVRKDSSDEFLSAEQTALIERLGKLNLVFSNADNHCTGGSPEWPSAWADPTTNRIIFCERANVPLEAHIPTLAHEIAHFMDPCVADRFPVDPRALVELKKDAAVRLVKCRIPAENERARNQVLEMIFEADRHGGITASDAEEIGIRALFACGVLKAPEKPQPHDSKNHPFESIRGCVSKIPEPNHMGLPQANQLAIESGTDQPPFPNILGFKRECRGKVRECFADHLGAEVSAMYIARHRSLLRPGYQKWLLGPLLPMACLAGDWEGSTYPGGTQRLATFLQYPEIQDALGCKGLEIGALCRIGKVPAGSRAAQPEESVR